MRVLKNIMQKYIDAHCHASHTPEVGAIVNAARISDWATVLALVRGGAYGAIGVHPWYISELPHDWDVYLYKILTDNPGLLVGEIGLDKHKPAMETQISAFIRQLTMAHELDRGVCIHCVGVWDKMANILKINRNNLPPFILAHGYNGPVNMIQKFATEYNMYFSYGGRNLRNPSCILATPHNRILAETDSENPSAVIGIVNKIADILGVDPDKMADIIYDNTNRMLKHG